MLSADDVLTRKFQPTRFREGYDIIEVDDFLDEVVQSMSKLQNDLAAAKAEVEALKSGGAVAAEISSDAEVATVDPTKMRSYYRRGKHADPEKFAASNETETDTKPATDLDENPFANAWNPR